jgi:hypothetical protein
MQLGPCQKDQQGSHKVSQFYENYGYDLEKTLQQFAIREMEAPQQKERLLRSLQRVNAQQVTALYLHDSQHLLYLRRHSCKASH